MHSLEWFARDRIAQFRTQALSVGESDSLFASAEDALGAILGSLDDLEHLLEAAATGVSEDDPAVIQACITVNQKLSAFTTYLGIILRSSNTRNSFEYFFALNEIATHFTGNDKRLILSSEWEYSPFYIPQPPEALRGFVFIGFPAYLSRNSLLLPLAAHELAHAIWHLRSLEGPIASTLQMRLNEYADKNKDLLKQELNRGGDLFFETEVEQYLSEVLDVAVKQAEEVFCDMFGVALFRESYIYAFNSFVLPGSGARLGAYPTLAARLSYMRNLAAELSIGLKSQPSIGVDLATPRRGAKGVADAIVGDVSSAVSKLAVELAAEIRFQSGDSAADIRTNFRQRVPALRPSSPVEILNATWDVYLQWLEEAEDDKARHEGFRIMNNICLKSLEVYEISRTKPY